MKDNAIQQLKDLAKIYANIQVENFDSELNHWESVWNWVSLVMQSQDQRLRQIKSQISEIWLVPGSTCEITEEF